MTWLPLNTSSDSTCLSCLSWMIWAKGPISMLYNTMPLNTSQLLVWARSETIPHWLETAGTTRRLSYQARVAENVCCSKSGCCVSCSWITGRLRGGDVRLGVVASVWVQKDNKKQQWIKWLQSLLLSWKVKVNERGEWFKSELQLLVNCFSEMSNTELIMMGQTEHYAECNWFPCSPNSVPMFVLWGSKFNGAIKK